MDSLLEETEDILSQNGKALADVRWWGCRKFRLPQERLRKLLDVRYDSGYGGQEIATDLLIVGDDWWLERHEYDGSEWWEYKTMPDAPVFVCDKHSVKKSGRWNELSDFPAPHTGHKND